MCSVFVLGLFYVYQHYWQSPKSADLVILNGKIAESQARVQENQALLAKLTARSPASEEVKTSHHLLDQYLKSNNHFSNVVTSIVESSKNDAFLLTKISSDKQAPVSGYVQTLYHVEVEASFIAIGKFLERLEDSSLLTEVDSIDITRLGTEMKRCKANINLFSYVTEHE